MIDDDIKGLIALAIAFWLIAVAIRVDVAVTHDRQIEATHTQVMIEHAVIAMPVIPHQQ